MERRRPSSGSLATRKQSTALPVDYTRMVTEVFTTNFDEGLKALHRYKTNPRFEVSGGIFPDEILLSIALVHEGHLAATTAHASVDFDPKASAPSVPDVLAVCVDALGALFDKLLDPKDKAQLEALAQESLSAFDGIPFEWTPVQFDKHRVFLRVDKSNPKLDEMTDEWLLRNDPEALERERREQELVQKRFVTGERAKRGLEPGSDLPPGEDEDGDGSSGTTH
jgi:hypothetical protein